MENVFDCIIIGAGPGGMNAALYASRANLKVVMIEKECPGGKMVRTDLIENYIGGSSTNGVELASKMFSDSIKFGAKYKQGNVVSIESEDKIKIITLSNGEVLKTKTVIIAVGGSLSKNQFKYDNYLNKGLSYCVVCDGNFYAGKKAAVIGSDKAIEDVFYLSNIARDVLFINKDNSYCNRSNVTTLANVKDYKILGEDKVEAIEVNGEIHNIDGVFYVEDTNNFNGFVSQLETENGYIKVDKNMHTNIEGIYACGDIVNKNIKQVISACADGAIAALEAIKYVNKNK